MPATLSVVQTAWAAAEDSKPIARKKKKRSVFKIKEVNHSPSRGSSDMPQQNYPLLEMVAGPFEGKRYSLEEGENHVGRDGGGIVIEDTSISRRHAVVSVADGKVMIADAGSRNGTFLNGRKLKAGEALEAGHLDLIRIGICVLKLLAREMSEEEILAQEKAVSAPTEGDIRVADDEAPSAPASFVATSEKAPEARVEQGVPEDELSVRAKPEESVRKPGYLVPVAFPEEPKGFSLKHVFWIMGALSVLGGIGYLYVHQLRQKGRALPAAVVAPAPAPAPVQPAKPAALPVEVYDQVAPPPLVNPEPKPEPKPEPASQPSAAPARPFTIYLDIDSKPASAQIFLNDKLLGATPLKVPVEVENGKEYTVIAEFDLRDIRDKYQQKLTFVADARREIVPLSFDAELGVFKVVRLPRNIGFEMRGFYAYDKFKSNPVRLSDIVYGKPVYLPYGHYVVELREDVRVPNSTTTITEIRYTREFDLSAGQRLIELAVNDRDLQFFPASIDSKPAGADVLVDGQKLGVTPFRGDLPLGRHELKLAREGYFDEVIPLDIRTNALYQSVVELKTSRAGEFINKADELRRAGQCREAITGLIEALKVVTSERESAEIHLKMGECHYLLHEAPAALNEFEKAKNHPDFRLRTLLGMAKAHQMNGNHNAAVMMLAEVLINSKDGDPLKSESQAYFKQISPIKSVLFVVSDPPGADVMLNNMPVAKTTPVLLSDLGLGSYRIQISKPGFKTEQVKQSLKLGEFIPIVVKLTPGM